MKASTIFSESATSTLRQAHDRWQYILVESHAGSAYTCPPPPPLLLFSGQPPPLLLFPFYPVAPSPALVDQIWPRRIPARSNTPPRAGLGCVTGRDPLSKPRRRRKSRRRRGTQYGNQRWWSKNGCFIGQVEAPILAKLLIKDFFCYRYRNGLANVLPCQRGFLLPNAHTTQHTRP